MLFFVWNSVLGGMDALVLCLHSEGEAHIEVLGKDTPGADGACAGSDAEFSTSECPPCTDITLASVDLGSMRSHEVASVQVRVPLIATQDTGVLPEATLRPKSHEFRPKLPRGPPDVEPVSEQISRLIVLRL